MIRAAVAPHAVGIREDEREQLTKIDELLVEWAAPAQARLVGPAGDVVDMPAPLFEVIKRAVQALLDGGAVELVSYDAELTTRRAAEILNVSRPHLVKLLDEGRLPFRRVGSHRRVRVADLMTFKREQDRQRRQVLRKLAAEARQQGFYDDWSLSDSLADAADDAVPGAVATSTTR